MPYLAQYSIRSKQDYIFHTNAMVEMTGASLLIRDSFDILLACARDKAGLVVRDAEEKFDLAETLSGFASGSLNMAELFRGGGNSLILFDTEESFINLNSAYTYHLASIYPGLVPLCAGIPVGDNGTWNYQEDYQRLRKHVSDVKSRMTGAVAIYPTPFSEILRDTYQPVTRTERIHGKMNYISAETGAKRDAFALSGQADTLDIDSMSEKKGTESLLAVVHADGNNMGVRIRGMMSSETSYTECVNRMRKFVRKTAEVFSEHGKEAVEAERRALEEATGKSVGIRWLINDGDDATFICNARHALRFTKAYLKAVAAEPGYTSCAGICIFHSHYPFYMAYSFAEQCCDNAKKKVHIKGETRDESWIDFHYQHSGLDRDLDDLRKVQGTDCIMARPYCVTGGKLPGIDVFSEICNSLKQKNAEEKAAVRGNLKTIGNAWEGSRENGKTELHRLFYRNPALEGKLMSGCESEEELLKILYDLSEIFDVWYSDDAERSELHS